MTLELKEELSNRYLQLIEILCWGIELGCVDIITEVSILLQYQCSPREGHLDTLYCIFWYLKCKLKKKHYSLMVFDGSVPYIDEQVFEPSQGTDWNDFYLDAAESIPVDAPRPREQLVSIGSMLTQIILEIIGDSEITFGDIHILE